MYQLNEYGKIVINEKEIYYGCVAEADSKTGVLKLYVVDWMDRHKEPRQFYTLLAPMSRTIIKYNIEVEQ